MPHPFPQLTENPLSRLGFPWAEYTPDIKGSFRGRFGNDGGVGLTLQILIYWEDLNRALPQLLGFSTRQEYLDKLGNPKVRLSRTLPWQHPRFNQLWVKAISSITGAVPQGRQEIVNAPGIGPGGLANLGPASTYKLAIIDLEFWRPPYYVLSDEAIVNAQGDSQEYLRYVDMNWKIQTQMLNRDASSYDFCTNQGVKVNFTGSVGQKVTHIKLSRTWYQIPQNAIFAPITLGPLINTPQGLPMNLMYMQTPSTNPITNYFQPAGVGLNFAANGPILLGSVNSPMGGGIRDNDVNNRFFGCFMGTLLYESVEITPRPLHLPPNLMNIPIVLNSEPLCQQQYDVTFNFDLFDPPRSIVVSDNLNPVDGTGVSIISEAFRGHNTMPWTGNGMWYGVQSRRNMDGTDPGGTPYGPSPACPGTPFMYGDFYDLFKIL